MTDVCPMGGKDQKLVNAVKPAAKPTVLEPDLLTAGDRIVFQNKVLEFLRREGDVEHGGIGMVNHRYVFVDIMDDDDTWGRALSASEVRGATLLGNANGEAGAFG